MTIKIKNNKQSKTGVADHLALFGGKAFYPLLGVSVKPGPLGPVFY